MVLPWSKSEVEEKYAYFNPADIIADICQDSTLFSAKIQIHFLLLAVNYKLNAGICQLFKIDC